MAVVPQAANTAYHVFKNAAVLGLLGIMRQRSPWSFFYPYGGQPDLIPKEPKTPDYKFLERYKAHPLHANGLRKLRRHAISLLKEYHTPTPRKPEEIPRHELVYPPNLTREVQQWGKNNFYAAYLRVLLRYNDLIKQNEPLRNAYRSWSPEDFTSPWFLDGLTYENEKTLKHPSILDVVRMHMRPEDRAYLWDTDPQRFELLKSRVGTEKNFSLYNTEMFNEWSFYDEFNYPTSNGMCVIEHPIKSLPKRDFVDGEHMDLLKFLITKFRFCHILITYPILTKPPYEYFKLLGDLGAAERFIRSEVYFKNTKVGAGLILVNPPPMGGPILGRVPQQLGEIMQWGYSSPWIKEPKLTPAEKMAPPPEKDSYPYYRFIKSRYRDMPKDDEEDDDEEREIARRAKRSREAATVNFKVEQNESSDDNESVSANERTESSSGEMGSDDEHLEPPTLEEPPPPPRRA